MAAGSMPITRVAHTLFEDIGIIQDGVTALDMGAPAADRLRDCARILGEATEALLKDQRYMATGSAFQYGPMFGDPDFREELSKLINSASGNSALCTRDNLVLTGGATHGLHLVTSLLFRSGDPVFVEDPTYFIAIQVLRKDLGMQLVTVATDSGGINVEALDTALTDALSRNKPGDDDLKENSKFSALVYLVPTFNNPTGGSMDPDRCRRLIKVARKHNALLMCDDVYVLLYYPKEGSTRPLRLLEYDCPDDEDYRGGCVISNGSFSKILGPGVRAGWIESGPRVMSIMRKSNILWSGGSTNHYMSMVLTEAMKLGLCQRHIEVLKQDYGGRMRMVCRKLKELIPPGVTFTEPQGGYFVWLTLPETIDAVELLKFTKEKYKLSFIPGPSFSPSGGSRNCLRISISFYPEGVLNQATQALCEAICDFIKNKPPSQLS